MGFPDLLNDVPEQVPLSLSQINFITFCIDIEKINIFFVWQRQVKCDNPIPSTLSFAPACKTHFSCTAGSGNQHT